MLDGLGRVLGAGIGSGDSALVIATKAHREGLAERLKTRGVDLGLVSRQGRFLSLDAEDTLAKFMASGSPNPASFTSLLSELVSQLSESSQTEEKRVLAFGEMVALLWGQGKHDAAIALEKLWNQLAETRSFHLHCAYPLQLFPANGAAYEIAQICAEHSDHAASSATGREKLNTILHLHQRTQTLQTELDQRATVQRLLEERETELKDYLENAAIGMHWVSADGTILWANEAEFALLGYTRDEYVGHNISEFHADRAVLADVLQRLRDGLELRAYEVRLKAKNGSIRHVRLDSNVFARNGAFVHTRCFTTDLTERKLAEQGLFHLAAIVESADDAIVSKDLNGVVTSWNKSAERILGYTAEEMIGTSIIRIIPPELHQDEVMILSKIQAGERIEHFETVRVHKDGHLLDVSLTISPVRDREGRVIGAAKILRDITHQKRLEAALLTSEKLASAGRLAATIAHEINNPLASITNLVFLAKSQPEASDEIKRYLNLADQELRRAAHIAQQTLGFYRNTSQPVVVSVAEIIQDVLSIYQRKLDYKHLHVELRIDPGLTMNAWQGELKQILSNLIANAVDASREGGRLLIRARQSGSGVRFAIADTGIGITADDRQRVFNPFFTTRKVVGTGLGLWITRQLLEKRGGRIRFRSKASEPSGTVMSFYLPMATADSAEAANSSSVTELPSPSQKLRRGFDRIAV